MTKILTLLIGLSLISAPALAKDAIKDDGGFGSGFSGNTPVALGDYTAPDTNALAADTTSFNPADIEPAAGDEKGEEDPSLTEAVNAPSAEQPSVEKLDTEHAPQE